MVSPAAQAALGNAYAHVNQLDKAVSCLKKAAEMADWFAGRLPELPWNEIQQKAGAPTRNASSACLSMLSAHVKNMIVSSADLCHSGKQAGLVEPL